MPATAALPGRIRLAALPPLTLYIHIPWCLKKCPYCDFNSHEARGEVPESRYVDAVVADLEASVPRVWGRRVHASSSAAARPASSPRPPSTASLTAARTLLPVEPDAEITLEANPGTFEQAKFRDFRERGREPPVRGHPELRRRATCRPSAACTTPARPGARRRSRWRPSTT